MWDFSVLAVTASCGTKDKPEAAAAAHSPSVTVSYGLLSGSAAVTET